VQLFSAVDIENEKCNHHCMVKISMKLPNGTSIVVEGSKEDVNQILSTFSITNEKNEKLSSFSPKTNRKTRKGTKPRGTVMVCILELKSRDFFTKKKISMDQVKNALNEGGHYFRDAAIATALLRLVKRADLRRLKENGKWLYTFS
jgi:hypothetical protein